MKWLDAYHQERKSKPDVGEIEWRFDCFAKYIIDKGLGYPSRLVRKEKNRTDIRILTPEGISYSRDLVENLVLSALTVSCHETSRRAERGTGVKAAAITVWRQLKEAYQRHERRERKAPSSRGG